MSVLYAEDITTFNQQAGGFGAFGALGANVTAGLGVENLLGVNNFLTNRVFLQKRFNASVALNGTRNTVSFSIFNLTRTPYSPAIDDAELIGLDNLLFFDHTKQRGGNMAWNYQFSARTHVNTTFGYFKSQFSRLNGGFGNLIYTTSLNKRFSDNFRGSLEYRRIERLSSAQLGVQNLGRSANAVTISLTKNF